MKYPSYFLDTPKIKKSRTIAQKELSAADPFTFYTFRKFSIYLSMALVERTSITGNQISLFMVVFALLSAPTLVISNAGGIWYPLCYFIIYFLDVVDGEVARLRQQKSKLGKWLDILLWYLLDLYFILYCFYIFRESSYGSICLYLVIISTLMERYLNYIDLSREMAGKRSLHTGDRSGLKTFLKYSFTKPGHLFCLHFLYWRCLISYQHTYF